MSEGKQELAPIQAGNRGLALVTLDDYWRFSQALAKSGLAPKGLQSPEAILIAIQLGAEVGLPPMAAVQNVAVINNKPSLYGDVMLGICQASGTFCEKSHKESIEGEGDDMVASCTVRRKPDGEPHTETFSVRDAKTAELWGKPGPWKQYPKRMLKFRARGYALREKFSDFLRGFKSAEEVQDMPPETVEVTVTKPATEKPKSTLDSLADSIEAENAPDTSQEDVAAPVAQAPPDPDATQEAPEEKPPGCEAKIRHLVDELGWSEKDKQQWLSDTFNGCNGVRKLDVSQTLECIDRLEDLVASIRKQNTEKATQKALV